MKLKPTRIKHLLTAGSALADEEAIETKTEIHATLDRVARPAVPWPMRRPLKLVLVPITVRAQLAGSALADEEAIETCEQTAIPLLPIPAVPWPMRRPLKPADGLPFVDDIPAVPWPMRRPLKHSLARPLSHR